MMDIKSPIILLERIEQRIYSIREERIMLSTDLAVLRPFNYLDFHPILCFS